METKNLTRAQKIELLKNFESGKIKLHELSQDAVVVETWIDLMKAVARHDAGIKENIIMKGPMKELFESIDHD